MIANITGGEGSLGAAIRDFLSENDLSKAKEVVHEAINAAEGAAGRRFVQAGAEARLTADYFDARMHANLKAISKALTDYEADIQAGKTPSVPRFTALITEASKQQEVDPKAGTSFPDKVTIRWDKPDKSSFTIDTSQSSIVVSGFGFQQPRVASLLSHNWFGRTVTVRLPRTPRPSWFR